MKKTKIIKRRSSPSKCRGLDAVCALRTDHYDHKDLWILTDGYHVSIHRQKTGEPSSQEIRLTPGEFNRLVAWWQRPQVLTERTSACGISKGEQRK